MEVGGDPLTSVHISDVITYLLTILSHYERIKHTMTISLRLYRSDDLDSVVQLWYRSWHHAFPDLHHPQPIEQWKIRFQKEIEPNEAVWVAERGHQLLGFFALRESDGYLHQIFVSPEAQGQGVGTLLLKKAKQLSPRRILLDTLQRNTQARRFYERHGFRPGDLATNPINGHPNITYHWEPRGSLEGERGGGRN